MTGGEWAYLSTSLSTIQDWIHVDTASATLKDRPVGTATIVQGRPLTLSTWRFWRGGRGASSRTMEFMRGGFRGVVIE